MKYREIIIIAEYHELGWTEEIFNYHNISDLRMFNLIRLAARIQVYTALYTI